MTATPDVVVNIGGASGAATVGGDVDQAFIVGQTQRGSIAKPMATQSLTDFAAKAGARLTTSPMYDWTDTYNGESGTVAWLSRVASSTAAQATLNLLDVSAGVSLIVRAGQLGDPDPGTWANGASGGLSVAVVVSSGTFQIQTSLNGTLVESSPFFSTQADAIGWSIKNSQYIVLSLGASALIPAAAAGTPLASGTDGTTLVDADYQTALDRIDGSYGPGQIIAPGRVTAAGYLQVIAHAVARQRFALLDGPDSSSDATVEAAAQGVFGAPSNGRRWAQMIAPWVLAPGLTTYTSRDVPPTALLAAAYSRNAQLGANVSAAGKNGVAQWVQDLSQPNWSFTQRDALAAANVSVIRRRFGGKLMIYGNRTLADPASDANWTFAPNVRALMWYAHQARLVGDAHDFDTIDPFGHELAAYKGDLIGAAAPLMSGGGLWIPPGGKPSDAINVDVGPSVNPPSQLAQGIVQANVELRFSPNPDRVVINLIKTPMAQAV